MLPDRAAITGEPDPMPQDGHIEFVVHPPLVNVRIMTSADGKVVATAQIATQRGPLTFTASADRAVIQAVITRFLAFRQKMSGKPLNAASAGALGDWAQEIATKISQANVVTKLVNEAKRVGQNPQIARAVGLSTVVLPGPGTAVIALRNASELLQGLRRKDPKYVQSWNQLSAQAKLGNEKALRAMHVVHRVARAPRLISP